MAMGKVKAVSTAKASLVGTVEENHAQVKVRWVYLDLD
jgi:hypothetical protein